MLPSAQQQQKRRWCIATAVLNISTDCDDYEHNDLYNNVIECYVKNSI